MQSSSSALTRWLARSSSLWFMLYAVTASFCLYSCAFAYRKTFAVATFEGMELWGVDYKVWLITSQVLGYMTSKFIGIKYVSEATANRRGPAILLMIAIAMAALFLFAVTPAPYNIIFMYFNGLPLGMVWGLVFGYLEGRRFTEVLGAGVSASFIFASGFAKSVGSFVMLEWGVSQFWMPFVVACLFTLPLLFFLWMLNQLPPPSEKDEALRTRREPMDGKSRRQFFATFAPGLVLLIVAYVGLTAFREFRDNFMAEIWTSLGYGDSSAIFAYTETPVALITLVVCASVVFIKNNKTALVVNHLIVLAGMVLVGVATLGFQNQLVSAPVWMLLVGLGLYLGYVPFNSIFFDRLIAAFRYISNVGFLIYLADSFGYLGSVGVLFFKEFSFAEVTWLDFFITSGYILSVTGSLFMLLSLVYFERKHRVVLGSGKTSLAPRWKGAVW